MPAHAESGSVDPREVEYFDRFAQMWWDSAGPFWPLHRLNRLRLGYIKKQLCRHFGLDFDDEQPLQGLTVLDVGCGGGILSESMAKLGADVLGIDVVERNIAIARQHAQSMGCPVEYRLTTAESLAEEGMDFDVVLNMEVVEHVADLPGFMAAVSRLLKPGGMMFIATINRTALAWLVAIVGAEYILRWMPKGTHHWAMLRKPREISALLEANGLAAENTVGVGVDPLRRKMFLTPLTSVNYMLTATHGANAGVQ
ncbi:MAG: bifunctional 2-polyprenyl-6-hydroxyphenol methylase/3-demethylubiquinol 3-O-methyltransferase UbiG [Lysobacterales bacterium]|jgi:2-polyprenyl-6-hydroxyphenyl methylase/3-demethylubiquinone-9 3-methyltransferase